MIIVSNFRRLERNTLKGFVTLALDDQRLDHSRLHRPQKGGKAWIGLPAKPQINPRRRSQDGRAQRQAALHAGARIQRQDRARERFQQVALEAVRALIGEGLA